MEIKTNLNVDIIAYSKLNNVTIVLCALPDDTVTPWASWRVGDDGSLHWGHYYSNLNHGITDYCERSGLNLNHFARTA